MTKRAEYVGDGVYVVDGGDGGVWLHANDLHDPTDKIYLDESVVVSLLRVLEKWGLAGRRG